MHLDLNVLCIPSRHIAMPYGICLDFILGFVLDDIGSCPSWKLQGARHRHLGYCPKAHTYLCLSSSCPYHHAQIPVDTPPPYCSPPRHCDLSASMHDTPRYHAPDPSAHTGSLCINLSIPRCLCPLAPQWLYPHTPACYVQLYYLTDATALTLYAYAYMSIRTHTYTQFRNSHANK